MRDLPYAAAIIVTSGILGYAVWELIVFLSYAPTFPIPQIFLGCWVLLCLVSTKIGRDVCVILADLPLRCIRGID